MHGVLNILKKKMTLKSWNCLLTYWMAFTNIPFVLGKIYSNPFKCNCLKNKKLFLNVSIYFWNVHTTFEHFEERWSSYLMYFLNKGLRKVWLDKCLKSPVSVLFQQAKGSQTMLKSAPNHFYHIFSSVWGKYSFKMLLLVIFEILGLFVDTLTTDHKYATCHMEILQQSIQMQLSKKQKTLPELLDQFLKYTYKLWTFWKKYDPHNLYISETTGCERRG